MIHTKDQDELFELISSKIKQDITCYAFGGTAMMFYGYKEGTKDIDLAFETEEQRQGFIQAIEELGFRKISLKNIYNEQKNKQENKPLMFSRGDERFDLFARQIFQTKLTDAIKERSRERRDYIRKDNTLTVKVLAAEDIILLKSVTDRENDFTDIELLLKKEQEISWQTIVEEAVRQGRMTVLDLEEKMGRLKKEFYIQRKFFDTLYNSFGRKESKG